MLLNRSEWVQVYINPQGPGRAVDGAAAVCAHESQEQAASSGMRRLAPGRPTGTAQGSAEQAAPAGVSVVRVV